jgi:Immunity protein 53
MNSFKRLQAWYAGQCDGEWEHATGVQIHSVDDPGWFVRIGVRGTSLESRAFEPVDRLLPEQDWLRCRVRNGDFEACGGPEVLDEILDIFLDWAEQKTKAKASA